jgi:hypothetical protein
MFTAGFDDEAEELRFLPSCQAHICKQAGSGVHFGTMRMG